MTRLLGIGGSFPLLTRRLKPRRTGTLSRSSRYIRTDLWTPELSAMADCPSKFTSEGDVRLGHQEAAQTLRGSGLPGTGANARLWALRQEEHFLTVSMVLPGPSALLPPPPYLPVFPTASDRRCWPSLPSRKDSFLLFSPSLPWESPLWLLTSRGALGK